jgi:hypothetical protein
MSRTGEAAATMQQPPPTISTPLRVMTKSWGFLTFAAGFVASALLFGGTLTRATFLQANDAKVRWDYCEVYLSFENIIMSRLSECNIESGSKNEMEGFLKSMNAEKNTPQFDAIRLKDPLIYLGKNGWELVTHHEGRHNTGFYHRFYMKKAK